MSLSKLVLTRRAGESITAGTDVGVTVDAVNKDSVELNVRGPLTLKVGQTAALGPDVTVSVHRIRGKQVRLAIEAPREMEVHRAKPKTTAEHH